MRFISTRTQEVLAEITVPPARAAKAKITGVYTSGLELTPTDNGVALSGHLDDRLGRVLRFTEGVPDVLAAELVTIEISRADGSVMKRIAVVRTEEQP